MTQQAVFSFEATFDDEVAIRRIYDWQHWAVYASVIYAILLFLGRRFMSNRSSYELRLPLIVWNVLLVVFSVVGAVRTVPELIDGLMRHGIAYNICMDDGYYRGGTGVWAFLFTASKLLEFGDTAFIVLRKQPLQFLHWYHHITVMLYCFFSYPQLVASGRWYMVMNYCIHSVMYAYYAAKSMRICVPKQINILITALQILQMIAGLAIAVSVGVMKYNGSKCLQSSTNVAITIAMYVSYFVLFVQFFYHAYASGKQSKRKQMTATHGEGDNNSVQCNGDARKQK